MGQQDSYIENNRHIHTGALSRDPCPRPPHSPNHNSNPNQVPPRSGKMGLKEQEDFKSYTGGSSWDDVQGLEGGVTGAKCNIQGPGMPQKVGC